MIRKGLINEINIEKYVEFNIKHIKFKILIWFLSSKNLLIFNFFLVSSDSSISLLKAFIKIWNMAVYNISPVNTK